MADTCTWAPAERWGRVGFVLLIALLLLAMGGKSVLYDTLDPDLFWHLRVAEQLERDGIGPIVDQLSFSSQKEPWTPYSWLAELAMHRLWLFGGYRAAVAVQAVVIAAFFGIIAITCVEAASPKRTYIGIALAVSFAGYLALPYLSFRPVTFACVGLALAVYLLLRDRQRGERNVSIAALVPLTAVLVNVHLFALLIPMWLAALTVAAAVERWRAGHDYERVETTRCLRRYAVLTLCCAAACTATPMLPGMLRSVARYGTSDPMVSASVIAELVPFYKGSMWPVTGGVLLLAGIMIGLHRREFRLGEWLCLVIGAIGMFRMGRLAPICVLWAAPMLASSMPRLRGQLLARPVVAATLGLVLLAGAWRIYGAFPGADVSIERWLNRNGPDTPGYPCAAAHFIEANIAPTTGRVINDFTWGGYLAWELGPQFQVFMDARTQLYSPEFWRATCLGDAADLRRTLRGVPADAAVVPLSSNRLMEAIESLGWRRAFSDDRAAVYVPARSQAADIR